MVKQVCFTLRFNKCAIWWTALFVMPPYDIKGRAFVVSLNISKISLKACLKESSIVVSDYFKVARKTLCVSELFHSCIRHVASLI